MDPLHNVTTAAVWGSLGGSLFLGAFLMVQALFDRVRRMPYLLLALLSLMIVAVDFSRALLSPHQYELIRSILWSWHAPGVMLLLGYRLVRTAALGTVFSAAAAATWFAGGYAFASSVSVPSAFLITAFACYCTLVRRGSFAGTVLSGGSLALGLLCCCYYLFITHSDVRVIPVGYAYYAAVSLVMVLLGWVHLPRELLGKVPVTIPQWQRGAYIAAQGALTIAAVAELLLGQRWPPLLFLAIVLTQLLLSLVLFFHHRHRLVIYTDNIEMLLAERTRSLVEAQQKLAELNEQQSERLRAQALDLRSQAEIIDRQRRLELAAQTAGQVAHDIQNLISPMVLQISDSRLNEHSPDTARLRHSIGEILELNSQLLTLSRRGRREETPIDVQELLESVRARFPLVHVDGPGQRCWVTGSWAQLSRALTNLIINALDAVPAPREPRITASFAAIEVPVTKRCHLGFLKPGRYVRLAVHDNGSGIPGEILDKIFEPFFSSKHGKAQSGSGLGLSIVAAVVDDHDGIIDLETGSAGTIFSIYLPERAAPAPEMLSTRGSECVLLVDDDQATLRDFAKLLSDAGYLVHTAANGREALRVLNESGVDLLVLDMNMPEMSGYEAYLAAIHLQPGIPAIVHSSFLTDLERRKCGELGIENFLLKPAAPGDFLQTVRRILDLPRQRIAC